MRRNIVRAYALLLEVFVLRKNRLNQIKFVTKDPTKSLLAWWDVVDWSPVDILAN
jgi:hypothetical protein